MIKILSVDDEVDLEVLLTQYFRRKIRKGEYEFYFAHNGLEGLQQLLAHPDIDIVLSDINMPEMDGLTMLAKVNEMRNPALKVIMISAYGDMGNIRQAMNNGAFDFATKPIDLDDLQKSIDNAQKEIEFVRESQKEHAQLEDLESELRVAAEIQRAILPQGFENLAPGYDLAARMEPAKNVGGDFYDFFKIDDTHLGFVMADVSGKGVPASLFMAVSRTLLKACGTRGGASNEVVETVNNMLCRENIDGMFVTVFYGILNQSTGVIDYTNAGHNPPYVLRAGGKLELLPAVGNLVLGALDGMPFRSAQVQLASGDTFYAFTDGVTEAMNPEHEQYNESRLEALLPALNGLPGADILERVRDEVKAWASTAEQSDDITQLSIKRL